MVKAVKHDRQEVIQKATGLFWEKGFHATSMRNLQEVIDMRPGSIYASFGSKEGVFMEALRFYSETTLARLSDCAQASESPLEALRNFMQVTVLESRDSTPSDMCMLVKTVSELTEEHAELLAESKRLLNTIKDAFADLLSQAQACGELEKSKDTKRLARFLQMQMMGLRAYTRANDGDERVLELIDDVFSCLQH